MYKLLSLLFITSCAAIATTPTPTINQTLSTAAMKFVVDSVGYVGVATVAGKQSYMLKFQPVGKTVTLLLHTCHREIFLDAPYEFQYIPSHNIEDTSNPCILIAKAIDESGNTSTALLDTFYPDKQTKYDKAFVSCNGKIEMKEGAFLCQARAGLVQGITVNFLPTFADGTNNCNKLKNVDSSRYEWVQSEGFCSYLFGSKDGQIFRLDTFGYVAK